MHDKGEIALAQMTIRNIDDTVYARLKARAKVNGRSLEGEVRHILDRAARGDRSALARRAALVRARLGGRYSGDAAADIRADRDR